jgi:CRISPR-associated protein Csm1
VQRNIGDRLRRKQDEEDHDFMLRKKALVTDLLCKLAGDIQKYGKAYHIALHTHLYQYRD